MMTLKEIERRCKDAFAVAGLDLSYFGIDIAINSRLTRTLGRCMYKRRGEEVFPYRIEFSRKFIETSTAQCIQDVILHECAHAIACIETGDRQGHNAYFKRVCAKLGTTNDGTTTEVELDKAVSEAQVYKYFVVCKECGQVCGKYHRAGKVIKNIEFYHCSCGGNLNVIQNF